MTTWNCRSMREALNNCFSGTSSDLRDVRVWVCPTNLWDSHFPDPEKTFTSLAPSSISKIFTTLSVNSSHALSSTRTSHDVTRSCSVRLSSLSFFHRVMKGVPLWSRTSSNQGICPRGERFAWLGKFSKESSWRASCVSSYVFGRSNSLTVASCFLVDDVIDITQLHLCVSKKQVKQSVRLLLTFEGGQEGSVQGTWTLTQVTGTDVESCGMLLRVRLLCVFDFALKRFSTRLFRSVCHTLQLRWKTYWTFWSRGVIDDTVAFQNERKHVQNKYRSEDLSFELQFYFRFI